MGLVPVWATSCEDACAAFAEGGHSVTPRLMLCGEVRWGQGPAEPGRWDWGSRAGLLHSICSVVVLWGNLLTGNGKQMGWFYMSHSAGL